MAFFNRKHKKLANCSIETLNNCYHESERNLKFAVASGDEKQMRKAMAQHQSVEYAMLYRNSPEFKQKQNQLIQSCKGRTTTKQSRSKRYGK